MLTTLRAAICFAAALESRLNKGSVRDADCTKDGALAFWFRVCWGLHCAVSGRTEGRGGEHPQHGRRRCRRRRACGCLTRANSPAHAMSRSEIDDIFAASAPPKKKTKTSLSQQQKTPTIPDPSKRQAPHKRRREKKHAKGDHDRFNDSRGSAPRASLLSHLPSSQSPPGRKTVDGYSIYKEDELGISTTGGGDHLIRSLFPCSEPVLQTRLFVRLTANAVRLPCLHPAFSHHFHPQVFECHMECIQTRLYPCVCSSFQASSRR